LMEREETDPDFWPRAGLVCRPALQAAGQFSADPSAGGELLYFRGGKSCYNQIRLQGNYRFAERPDASGPEQQNPRPGRILEQASATGNVGVDDSESASVEVLSASELVVLSIRPPRINRGVRSQNSPCGARREIDVVSSIVLRRRGEAFHAHRNCWS